MRPPSNDMGSHEGDGPQGPMTLDRSGEINRVLVDDMKGFRVFRETCFAGLR